MNNFIIEKEARGTLVEVCECECECVCWSCGVVFGVESWSARHAPSVVVACNVPCAAVPQKR